MSITDKRWGSEQILHEDERYLVKMMTMHGGRGCSWHRHEEKTETLVVVRGTLAVDVRVGDRDVTLLFCQGQGMTLPRGGEHRMRAPHGTVQYVESSAPLHEATRTRAVRFDSAQAALNSVEGVPGFIATLRAGLPVRAAGDVRRIVADGCCVYEEELVEGEVTHESAALVTMLRDPMAKADERTFVDRNGLVTKWFSDPARALRWATRSTIVAWRCPPVRRCGSWCAYRHVEGDTPGPDQAGEVLARHCRLVERHGHRTDRGWSEWFLRDRTLARAERHCPALAGRFAAWPGWSGVIASDAAVTSHWHGDLSLENVVGEVLIDWHDWYEGDLHYDAAKLLKSLHFSHSTPGVILVPGAEDVTELREVAESRGLDWDRVLRLLPVVAMKMAGAHDGAVGVALGEWAIRLTEAA